MNAKPDFDSIIDRRGTDSFKWDATGQFFSNPDALPLWVADMDFRCAPEILEACKKRLEHGILGYTVRTDAYYDAVTGWFSRRHGWDVRRESLAFSPPGVIFGLFVLIELLSEPGDEVIMQTPNYDSLMDIVKKSGRRLIENPMICVNGRYETDLEQLEAAITPRTRIMLMANPNNPTGRLWTRDELRGISDVCRKKGVFILSDDIHCDIVSPGNTYIPLASISAEAAENCVVCTSTNKTFNLGGLQMGTFVITSDELRGRYEAEMLKYQTRLDNVFGSIALETAYNECAYWVDAMNAYVAENRAALNRFLSRELPAIISCPMEATYFAWLDMRGLGKGGELERFLVEKCGVAFTPGREFSGTGATEGFMRVNLACPRATLMEALCRIKANIS